MSKTHASLKRSRGRQVRRHSKGPLIGLGIVALVALLVACGRGARGPAIERWRSTRRCRRWWPPPSPCRPALSQTGGPGARRTRRSKSRNLSYQCPACRAYALEVEPAVIAAFAATGKVRYEIQLPVQGAESQRAAEASYCAAEQDGFWPMHTLYRKPAAAHGADNRGYFQRSAAGDDGVPVRVGPGGV